MILKTNNDIALEMKDISYAYPSINNDTKALNHVNFSMKYGEITLIAGGSGSGKSTLFYVMNGVIPNNYAGCLEGELFINSELVRNQSIGQRSKVVGSVFQNAEEQIVQKLVKDEIAFGPENLGYCEEEIEKEIKDGCDSMNLNPNDETYTLSGGQKQRLITASTLALNTDIILLDEPLANLDKISSIALMQKLEELKRLGKAIAIIEHRLDMIMDYVDIVYDLNQGNLSKVDDKSEYLKKQAAKLDDICSSYNKKDNLLEIKNLQFRIKNKYIIPNLSGTIEKGDRIVILGDNGCGKTTLTKIIARLIKQSDGQIIQNINPKLGNIKGSKKWFKQVAYVFQNPNYQLFMSSVQDELSFATFSDDYCQKIIKMFELEPLLQQHPHSLSQGQKRKVSIASMLAMKSQVIIFDEPTVGQDYLSLKKLVNNINIIHQEEENTIITITHDIRCAEALCDKAIIMKDGNIVEVGGKELVRKYFE